MESESGPFLRFCSARFSTRLFVEARRHQRTCYFAAIADGSGREMAVPLSFLGKGRWKMMLWQDASDSTAHPEQIVTSESHVGSVDALTLKSTPSGGMVAILLPAD